MNKEALKDIFSVRAAKPRKARAYSDRASRLFDEGLRFCLFLDRAPSGWFLICQETQCRTSFRNLDEVSEYLEKLDYL